ncbi:MAG TPA: hypothetical protein VNR70_02655 [Steroidobacteraceae bacterium]|jgi:ElaB/YqjD/DUF883 family membrane-anchored ribosome-binding protein|nr:hypothetical protein [Steroidobacteraceae bacterium]
MGSVAGQTVVRLKDFHVRDVGNRVSDAVSSLADQLVDGVQGWTSRARSAAKTTDGFVRSSPWQAVGAIALAGVAAGILVSRGVRRARRRGQSDPNGESTSEVLGG